MAKKKSSQKNAPKKGANTNPKTQKKKIDKQKRQRMGKRIASLFQWIAIAGLLVGIGLPLLSRYITTKEQGFDPTLFAIGGFLLTFLSLIGWGAGVIYRGEISGGLMKTQSSGKDNSLVVGMGLIIGGSLFAITLIIIVLTSGVLTPVEKP